MKLVARTAFLAVVLSACSMLSGCKHSTEMLGHNTVAFPLKGTVVATDTESGTVTVEHDAIPGFMEAMTMPYKLDRREVAGELHPGDVIRARLVVTKDSDGVYHGAKLNEIAVIAQKRLDTPPAVQYHVPAKGDAVPNFALQNQDGKAMTMSSLKGKAVILTFIYTRCPLGDFCPKMTRDLRSIQTMIDADPSLKGKTDLLSISFDPAYDTPEVLRAYGKNYVGKDGFAHWQFARAKDAATLTAMERYFNLGATPEQAGSITHSLSTVVIDRKGRIAEWLPGSEWSPNDAFATLKSAAAAN